MRVLWSGGKSYRGRFYGYRAGELDELASMGGPLRARIPIWVVAVWPRPKSMNRGLRCEGVVPQYEGAGDEEQPEHAQAVREWLDRHGGGGIDLVAQGETPADDPEAARASVADWAGAGCTWWLETRWEMPHGSAERMGQVRDRLARRATRAGLAPATCDSDGSWVRYSLDRERSELDPESEGRAPAAR